MWGIPKDFLADEDDGAYVIGEMDRDSHQVSSLQELGKYPNLERLAAAAFYHGAWNVILTKQKAYAVTTDNELLIEASSQ
jgi:hypothetical protein